MGVDQVIAVLNRIYCFTISDGHVGTELFSGAGENRGRQGASHIVGARRSTAVPIPNGRSCNG